MNIDADNRNWCGAGRMLSIDAGGNFYPCTRFAQYSLRTKMRELSAISKMELIEIKLDHSLCLIELSKALMNVLIVKSQVVVDGVRVKTMIYPKLERFAKEVWRFVACIKQGYALIIIIGTSCIASWNSLVNLKLL